MRVSSHLTVERTPDGLEVDEVSAEYVIFIDPADLPMLVKCIDTLYPEQRVEHEHG